MLAKSERFDVPIFRQRLTNGAGNSVVFARLTPLRVLHLVRYLSCMVRMMKVSPLQTHACWQKHTEVQNFASSKELVIDCDMTLVRSPF
jgi:hypothetical protein